MQQWTLHQRKLVYLLRFQSVRFLGLVIARNLKPNLNKHLLYLESRSYFKDTIERCGVGFKSTM
jgi:hypothetical protein